MDFSQGGVMRKLHVAFGHHTIVFQACENWNVKASVCYDNESKQATHNGLSSCLTPPSSLQSDSLRFIILPPLPAPKTLFRITPHFRLILVQLEKAT